LVKVIIDLCVVPGRVGVYVSRHVEACQQVLEDAGPSYRMHVYRTNIEGEWDNVFAAAKSCHEVVHETGTPSINTTIKLGTRIDRVQTMANNSRAS